jgi:chromosome segregation ATPase
MEEHEVLAMSFQEVTEQLDALRKQHGVDSSSRSVKAPELSVLKAERERLQDHQMKLAGVLAERGVDPKASLEELTKTVEACVGNERMLSERAEELEREITAMNQENVDLLEEHEVLVKQYKELQQLNNSMSEDNQALVSKMTAPPDDSEKEEVRVELVLAMKLSDIHEGDEQEFEAAVAQDVADAVGGDVTKVRVLSLQPGSIKVSLALDEGVCGDAFTPLAVANKLKRQAKDQKSLLKKGRYTRTATGVTVSVVSVPKVDAQRVSSKKKKGKERKSRASAIDEADFSDEISRLSALAEHRRLELIDTHTRIATLESELDVLGRRAQKTTADMYAEMDRLQAQIDSKNVELRHLRTQLNDTQTSTKEWDAHSSPNRSELEAQVRSFERMLAASEEEKEDLRKQLEKQEVETRELWTKVEGNADALRENDEGRTRENSRLLNELEQAHFDKTNMQTRLIEAEASLASRQGMLEDLTSQVRHMQSALESAQQENAKVTAEVYALQTGAASRLDEASLLERLKHECSRLTRERDEAQANHEQTEYLLAEVKMEKAEAERSLSEWRDVSRAELERLRQEMTALSEQLQVLSLENSGLRRERENLLHTLSDARRAQGSAEEAIGRLEFHMKEMENEMQNEREAEHRASQQVHQMSKINEDRLLALESERRGLVESLETSKQRLLQAERQRDALLPQVRQLKEDLRRVQELGLEQKLRDSLVRISDAEYQQALVESQVRALQVELAQVRGSTIDTTAIVAGAETWEGRCRELMSKLSLSETESARKDGQVKQLEHRLDHSRQQLEVAERQVVLFDVHTNMLSSYEHDLCLTSGD